MKEGERREGEKNGEKKRRKIGFTRKANFQRIAALEARSVAAGSLGGNYEKRVKKK